MALVTTHHRPVRADPRDSWSSWLRSSSDHQRRFGSVCQSMAVKTGCLTIFPLTVRHLPAHAGIQRDVTPLLTRRRKRCHHLTPSFAHSLSLPPPKPTATRIDRRPAINRCGRWLRSTQNEYCEGGLSPIPRDSIQTLIPLFARNFRNSGPPPGPPRFHVLTKRDTPGQVPTNQDKSGPKTAEKRQKALGL